MGLRTVLGLKRSKTLSRSKGPKYGVLSFGYQNFFAFEQQLQRSGSYDINLGDNAQSIAARSLLREFGIGDEQIVAVNRDTLPHYSGPPCTLIMNAVFFQQSFPLPASIRPVFLGFQASEQVIKDNIALFKLHQPIGCRDTATTERMRRYGVDAFTTGCITMSLPRREEEPADGCLLIVYGSDFPSSVLQYIPKDLSERCEFIYHRLPVAEFPVSAHTCQTAESYERVLLDRYRTTAKLVLTPLHHVAAPCMAMGIPVIVCRSDSDERFSFLKDFTPIYTPETFAAIDWKPEPIDVSAVKSRIREVLCAAIGKA
ncbi:hypothetical protein RLW55_16730 [Hyphomicrobium sp. B1]|uniref:hypothetical protein n=1 Tax=Hyphomicrobium sp. B1 TaxID=3075651 RepID=UPI003C2B9E33